MTRKKGMINITGAAESRVAPIIGKILKEDEKGQCLVVVSSYVRAKRLATDLSFFVDKTIYILPPEEEGFLCYEAVSYTHLDVYKRQLIFYAKEKAAACATAQRIWYKPWCILILLSRFP